MIRLSALHPPVLYATTGLSVTQCFLEEARWRCAFHTAVAADAGAGTRVASNLWSSLSFVTRWRTNVPSFLLLVFTPRWQMD